MSERLEICQSDPLSAQRKNPRAREGNGAASGCRVLEKENREPSSVVLCTECGGAEGLLQATSFPSISVVGPLQSSRCPAPSQFPLRTYQEHEDDGALVDVVHQVTRLLAKPAPAKTGWR